MSAAVITGASSGIGREFARLLAAEGYDLILVARRAERLTDLSRELGARHGTHVVCVPLDLSDPAAPRQLFEQTTLDVEVLVNNAGITPEARFLDRSWAWQQGVIQLMSTGPLELIHHFLPAMLERHRGHVINISSVGAWYPSTPTQTLYGATKAFLLRATHSLADEYPDSGVTFTAVCPGITRTEILDQPGNQRAIKGIPNVVIDSPRKVAEVGWRANRKGRRAVVVGISGRGTLGLMRALPERLGGKVIASQLLAAYQPDPENKETA